LGSEEEGEADRGGGGFRDFTDLGVAVGAFGGSAAIDSGPLGCEVVGMGSADDGNTSPRNASVGARELGVAAAAETVAGEARAAPRRIPTIVPATTRKAASPSAAAKTRLRFVEGMSDAFA
jgi:hypothetical protein